VEADRLGHLRNRRRLGTAAAARRRVGRPLACAALACGALVAAGCGGGNDNSSSSGSSSSDKEGGTITIQGQDASNHGTKDASGASSVEVEMDDYYFEPTVLKGKPGSSVTLELKNEGSVEHNFTIDSQGIDKDLEAGEDAKVSVTIPKSGVVSFYCKYHKSMGMAGALTGGANGGMTGSGTTSTEDTTTGKGY
jgi:plastocyanin